MGGELDFGFPENVNFPWVFPFVLGSNIDKCTTNGWIQCKIVALYSFVSIANLLSS